jgi:hypothetical protein
MSLAQGLPARQASSHPMLAQLETAVLHRDIERIRAIVEQLDTMSANECLRQLGEEWGFPTIEIRGQRLMAMRDLARLVYDYDQIGNLRKILARFGRKPIYLQAYTPKYRASIRSALGIDARATSVALATWTDLLLVGMRGHTDGAKKLQAYLLKAERDNRIHWTMQQLQAGGLIERIGEHLQRPQQINWSKRRNDLLFREGLSLRRSWGQSHVAHTHQTTRELTRMGQALQIKDIRKPGERLSALKVIREIHPDAAASISAESEYMVRGLKQADAERIAVQYIQPLARELRAFGLRMREEVDFARDLEEGV